MSAPTLRRYQKEAINDTISALYKGENPCIVAPTGAGKSWMIAGLIKECIERFPETKTRVLMLTHQKELIEQDAGALKNLYPEADVGIYSASIGRRELNNQIVYASTQSLFNCKDDLMHKWHLVIIDEAHKVNAEGGRYRKLIDAIQPVFVIGFTATPFRLGQGYLNSGEKHIFTKLIASTTIRELQEEGRLAYMLSRGSKNEISMDGVKIVNGDYDKEEASERIDTFKNNDEVTDELLKDIDFFGLKHMLIFSPTVKHSGEISKMMNDKSEGRLHFEVIHGGLGKEERESLISLFRDGNINGLVNCEVLTTGFDYPDIDSVVMLRPTQSTALYAQMAGRGLRAKTTGGGKYGGGNCYLFDFVGNVKRHGVIQDINFLEVQCGLTGKGKKKEQKEEKVKCCPHCLSFIPMGRDPTCPICGRYLEDKKLMTGNVNDAETEEEKKDAKSSDPDTYRVNSWLWKLKKTKKGEDCIVVYYFTDVITIMEWINLYSCNSYAKGLAMNRVKEILGFTPRKEDVNSISRITTAPKYIKAWKNKNYWKVEGLSWS